MDPVILLAGDDDLLLHRELERLVASLTAEDPSVEPSVHDVTELEHLPEMRTGSLFGGRACIVLRGAESVTGTLKTELETYLEAPSHEVVLVVVARGVGRIQRIAKLAGTHGRRVDVRRPADYDDRAWSALAAAEFERLARVADPSAVAAIRLHAGTDPTAIASQVASVCAATDAAPITAAEVEAVVEGHGRASGFAVADAVAERDPERALVALRGALVAGEAPLAIAGALTFRSRQLLQARAGAAGGMSPGQQRRMQGLARRFGPGELAWWHDRLARLDLQLKGSELPDTIVLEVAVIELATPREVGAPWNPLAAA
jgi:DNA polymerase III subunit delta